MRGDIADQPFGTPDEMLSVAVAAARRGEKALRRALDDLPAPIYTTDGDGWVTFFNRACIGFSGRTPVTGKDRWCVTWKLRTMDGQPLPHELCPMADAIKQKKEIRGASAIAERPDGTRVTFRPYPTPLFDDTGDVVGAVNILIDITDRRQIEHLRDQAERCRRLAQSVTDRQTLETLTMMAAEYDEKAIALKSIN